eukprot:TRINITY_DN27150_c0_g1_i1.p2 TRINITY_DN27150_c0_g1~~TRINITY_DN27150_c0_g1_i1.p2  ORF type:complete len:190 (-),score=51.77 TRINITY_DN27150_c0_g1_i1:58-627(-)
MAFAWLIYLSFVTTPRSAVTPTHPVDAPAQPEPAAAAPKRNNTAPSKEAAPAPAEQEATESVYRKRSPSLDMTTKDHVEKAREKAQRASPRVTPSRRREQKEPAELPQSRKDQLREVFVLFDKEQSGFLTRQDFFKIGRALKGLRWTEACNSEKFNKINTSKSGVLSEGEFLDFFKLSLIHISEPTRPY